MKNRFLFTVLLFGFLARVAAAAGGSCPASVPSDITNCYYIDYVGGSDSNAGTSEGAAWKRAPGMVGTVNGVGPGAIDDAAGDGCPRLCSLPNTGLIFKGGVTWPSAVYQWAMRQEGTSLSARFYIGVDPTWFTGGSWTRPILDLGGSAGGFKCAAAVLFAPVRFVVFDNFEFTGLYWDHTCNGSGNSSEAYLSSNGGSSTAGSPYIEIEHLYVHGWAHEAYSPNNTADACDLLAASTEGSNVGSSVHDSVIDGSDTARDACAAIWGSPNILYNNYIAYVSSGFVGLSAGPMAQFYQNTVLNIVFSYDPTQHMNCYESNADDGIFFYNNYILHGVGGYCVAWATRAGHASYFFNNIIVDSDPNENFVMAAAGENLAASLYVYNNTIENGHDGSNPNGAIGCMPAAILCEFKNNVFITSAAHAIVVGGSGAWPVANATETNDLKIDQATFNTDGYTIGSTYAFSPPGGGITIGAGVNLTSTSPGCSTAGLSALCSDTTAGVSYNLSNHTVIVPKRTAIARPSSGTWDAGAYNSGITVSQPSAPVGLIATVN